MVIYNTPATRVIRPNHKTLQPNSRQLQTDTWNHTQKCTSWQEQPRAHGHTQKRAHRHIQKRVRTRAYTEARTWRAYTEAHNSPCTLMVQDASKLGTQPCTWVWRPDLILRNRRMGLTRHAGYWCARVRGLTSPTCTWTFYTARMWGGCEHCGVVLRSSLTADANVTRSRGEN